jgi:hypothetical protein
LFSRHASSRVSSPVGVPFICGFCAICARRWV